MAVIMTWLRSNPLISGLLAAVLIVGLLAGIKACAHYATEKEVRNDNTHETVGAQQERLRANQEVINAVQQANDARDNPQPDELERMRQNYDRSRSADHK
jgi:hypothetical protein